MSPLVLRPAAHFIKAHSSPFNTRTIAQFTQHRATDGGELLSFQSDSSCSVYELPLFTPLCRFQTKDVRMSYKVVRQWHLFFLKTANYSALCTSGFLKSSWVKGIGFPQEAGVSENRHDELFEALTGDKESTPHTKTVHHTSESLKIRTWS